LGGALLGLATDLCRALASRREHPRRLLTEHAREGLVVEGHRLEIRIGLGRTQLTLEEPLALAEPTEFRGDHPEKIANLGLVETTPSGTERSVGNRRRRRRIGASEGHGHVATLRIGATQMVAIDQLT
jgi:hypothetical protein